MFRSGDGLQRDLPLYAADAKIVWRNIWLNFRNIPLIPALGKVNTTEHVVNQHFVTVAAISNRGGVKKYKRVLEKDPYHLRNSTTAS